jgi:hypothetical protein
LKHTHHEGAAAAYTNDTKTYRIAWGGVRSRGSRHQKRSSV